MTDSTHARLELIQFVTRRQSELQGLRSTAFALHVMATMGLIRWLQPMERPKAQLVVIAVSIVLTEGSWRLVDWWYRTRCGRVSSADVGRASTASGLTVIGVGLDMTPWFPVAGFSAFVLVVAIYGVRIAFRDFPWRGYYLALIALPAVAPFVPPSGAMLAHFPPYAVTLLALAVVGILDHRLLRASLEQLRQLGQVGSSA